MRVVELFAGVGGFKLGLEGKPSEKSQGLHQVIWANQWEPSSKKQHATEVYTQRWKMEPTKNDPFVFENTLGQRLVNKDIETIPTIEIPDHELLCGGFPCQDYSVARTISGEMGIKGEKGKLWNSISRIIRESKNRPRIVLLENVPRLLNSPAAHRGLNFTVILLDLLEMGYIVEWRVINASEYGFPQKRKRVFILAYLQKEFPDISNQIFGQEIDKEGVRQWFGIQSEEETRESWKLSPFSDSFPIDGKLPPSSFVISLKKGKQNKSNFLNTGISFLDNKGVHRAISFKSTPIFSGNFESLGGAIEDSHKSEFEISDNEELRKYAYIKGEQKEWRIRKVDSEKAKAIEAGENQNLWEYYQTLTKGYDKKKWKDSRKNPGFLRGVRMGIIYEYSAGAMSFPDLLENPSRTIVTAEIGRSVSRMRHVIEFEKGRYRRLMPIELERLNMFPDNWTSIEGISDSRRGFLMGNALVVGIIESLAGPLENLIHSRSE